MVAVAWLEAATASLLPSEEKARADTPLSKVTCWQLSSVVIPTWRQTPGLSVARLVSCRPGRGAGSRPGPPPPPVRDPGQPLPPTHRGPGTGSAQALWPPCSWTESSSIMIRSRTKLNAFVTLTLALMRLGERQAWLSPRECWGILASWKIKLLG